MVRPRPFLARCDVLGPLWRRRASVAHPGGPELRAKARATPDAANAKVHGRFREEELPRPGPEDLPDMLGSLKGLVPARRTRLWGPKTVALEPVVFIFGMTSKDYLTCT